MPLLKQELAGKFKNAFPHIIKVNGACLHNRSGNLWVHQFLCKYFERLRMHLTRVPNTIGIYSGQTGSEMLLIG